MNFLLKIATYIQTTFAEEAHLNLHFCDAAHQN
jgi:hypothetical protein